jgi:hypothetical protein
VKAELCAISSKNPLKSARSTLAGMPLLLTWPLHGEV